MLVRWLVVVLALIGAVPVRICTCGAAHLFPSAPAPHDTDCPPPGPEPALESNSNPAEHHDADCHFVKPRPIMSLGLQCLPADVPSIDALVLSLAEPPRLEPLPGYTVRDLDPPPDQPLYLTYRVLRN
jgi:hypothetical protein